MVETHAHIYLDQFKEDLEEVLDRAKYTGVDEIYMPNIDHTTIDDMLEVESRYPQCIGMMGLHPCSVKRDFEKELYVIEEWLTKRPWSSIGEIGTDLYWDKTFWEQQREAFTIQCNWAIEHDLPVVIHCRDSIDETIELIERVDNPKLKGVFHCFTGDSKQAQRITALGFYLGIGGVVTFKNGGLDKVVPDLDLDRLVLETDSPYLAPTPNRGKRNEPSYLRLVAQKVADVKNMDVEAVVEATSMNAKNLFK